MAGLQSISSRVWSTDAVAPARALDYWVATVCDHLLEMQIDSAAQNTFRGELRQSAFGVCGLSMIEAEGQEILRTRAMIGKSRFSDYRLLYFRSGGGSVAQRGRTAAVSVGDCVLLDSTDTYALRFPERTACTVLSLPRDWLRNWIRSPDALIARPINVRSGWGATLASWLRCVDPDSLARVEIPEMALSEQVASLLAMAGAEENSEPKQPRNPLLGRLISTMRERCGEPDLTPQVVAAEHRISRRYLHMLFARTGTTFCDVLTNIRMDLAQRLLTDSRFRDLPVGEVAARCGFTEPSHFARRFKDRFNFSPRAFKQKSSGD